jgi:formyltetrahydrofolate-dependent phosphoribosylglycinamide formyltransferase
MLERLKKKWKVGGLRLLLIIMTFAIGGSLTGYAGRKIMTATGINNTVLYIIIYVILITVIWPLMVILVSLPMGQFFFFRKYIMRIGRKAVGMKQQTEHPETASEPQQGSMPYTGINPQSINKEPANIVIFASGAGSNAQQIINHFKNTRLAKIVLIVCNKAGAGVTAIAQKENIPLLMIEKERFFRGDAYLPEISNHKADLLVLAGFLWKIPQSLIDAFPKRIINIHPALLPKFGGRGMYGQYVHEAVLSAGEMESGITIHYVDEHYDNGDIIFQTGCPLIEGDTAETLAHRIHQLEHLHYPRVIEEVARKVKS